MINTVAQGLLWSQPVSLVRVYQFREELR